MMAELLDHDGHCIVKNANLLTLALTDEHLCRRRYAAGADLLSLPCQPVSLHPVPHQLCTIHLAIQAHLCRRFQTPQGQVLAVGVSHQMLPIYYNLDVLPSSHMPHLYRHGHNIQQHAALHALRITIHLENLTTGCQVRPAFTAHYSELSLDLAGSRGFRGLLPHLSSSSVHQQAMAA